MRAFLLLWRGQYRRAWPVLPAALASCLLGVPTVSLAGPAVLYTFSASESSGNSQPTNSDGINPTSALVWGSDSNLYGTTLHGGANGAGSIFRLTVAGSLSNLYSFPPATNSLGELNYDLGPNDLVQVTNGIFYGTTHRGGSNFNGTIFEFSTAGFFTNLHTFAADITNSFGLATSPDGATPVGAMVQGIDGNFYGTTQYGGSNGTGTIFQLAAGGAFTSLYSFSRSITGAAGTNGAIPNALVRGTTNVLYGTTQHGGLANAGTFFAFTLGGGFTQIASFNGNSPGSNSVNPNSALVLGLNGNFFGTSAYGGSQAGGTIFEITSNGAFTLLHSLPFLGAGAGAAMTLGVDGNFYGTTAASGLNGNGTLFRITPAGGFGAYPFGGLNTNSENVGGANPSAAPITDGLGNLYGTCADGGTNGSGVIYQITSSNFIPPFFVSITNPPPALTNVLVGASVILSNYAQGTLPLSYQWLLDGTNITESGALTNVLTIDPVLPGDVGSYTLLISNTWGAATSSVTVLTVDTPGVTISSPAPGARTSAPTFAGTATNAPSTNGYASYTVLTNVIFTISNLLNGSNITGTAAVSSGAGGASSWSFAATPFPGSNILSVQSADVSGNISPVVSRSFFYEVPVPLTILTTGSGTGTFTYTNGATLNLGQGYSITASPKSSQFLSWNSDGVITFQPSLQFVMQSNLVLTADFLARESPGVFISSPGPNARTSSPLFLGTATPSPLLTGVNPTNLTLTNVVYSLSNLATASAVTGVATLTSGATVSNWTITAMPQAGTNILTVQSQDISGGVSRVVSDKFFYKVPALFSLQEAGSGNGTFTATAQVAGDTLPTNGAMLNLDESYTITAKPAQYSVFSHWGGSAGSNAASTLVFNMQPNFAVTAYFNALPPVVTISSPAANVRTAAPVFAGTASSHLGLANVSYVLVDSLTGSLSRGVATLTVGSGSVSNWSIAAVPLPGTNTLTVTAEDSGQDASSLSRTFFYKAPAPLEILQAGSGSGALKGASSIPGDLPPTNGAMLNVGERYTLTAVPGKSSLFSNWSSPAGNTTNPVLSFIMQSNLVLTVTFVPDFFLTTAGTYNGLFFPPDAVAVETSGMFYNFVLARAGTGSGSLLIAGERYPFTAKFNGAGNSSCHAGPYQMALTLNSAIPQITGTVSASNWTANLTADLAANVLPSAQYTLLFEPSTNAPPDSPPGDGYALVTNHAGAVALSGALADGTSYRQSVAVSSAGDLPVYAVLYANNPKPHPGLLLGWLNLTNLQAAAPSNTLTWIKESSVSSALYTNGFTSFLSTRGSLWTNPPANTSAISLANGQLVISNAGLFLAFTNLSVSNNLLTNLGALPTNSLSGSVNPKTGLLTLAFANGNASATNRALGVFIQNTTNAGGFFLTPTNAGAFNLQP